MKLTRSMANISALEKKLVHMTIPNTKTQAANTKTVDPEILFFIEI